MVFEKNIHLLLEEEYVHNGVEIGFLITLQSCSSVALGHNIFKVYNWHVH